MYNYKKLAVWRKTHELVLKIYRETEKLPPGEKYGLTAQIRSSSSSIAANIAEGCGRGTDGELLRFLRIAMGSVMETEYHLLLCGDLDYLEKEANDELAKDIAEVKKMLFGLMNAITKRVRQKHPKEKKGA